MRLKRRTIWVASVLATLALMVAIGCAKGSSGSGGGGPATLQWDSGNWDDTNWSP
jgi:hypothetical protein